MGRVLLFIARRVVLPALFIATFAALVGVLRVPPPWTLDLGLSCDTRYLGQFSIPEVSSDGTTFRWSLPESFLMLHGAGYRPSVLALRLYGEMEPGSGNGGEQRVRLRRAGENEGENDDVATLGLLPGWRTYRVLLPGDALGGSGLQTRPLALVCDTYHQSPLDHRERGVPLDQVQVIPLPGAAAPLVPALRRSLFLVWALVVLVGLAWRLQWERRSPYPAKWASLWRVGQFSGVAAFGLVLWAARDPYRLAWALPAMPWTLGVVTLVLLLTIRRIPLPFHPYRRGSSSRLPPSATTYPPRPTEGGVSPVTEKQLTTRPPLLTTASLAPRVALFGLGLVFLLSVGMRFSRLPDLPYGLWRDEARHGLVALRILEDPTYRPVYEPGHSVDLPALGFYPFALALRLQGIHPWTMRVVTALAGALTVFPLYGLTVCLTGKRGVALLAATFLAISSWHTAISRLSFPTIFDPLLTLTGLWLMLLPFSCPSSSSSRKPSKPLALPLAVLLFVAAGVCLGMAVQTYHTGRLVPLLTIVLALTVFRSCWPRWQFWLAGMALVVVGFALTVFPLGSYAVQHPDAFNRRVGGVFLLSDEALQGQSPLAALDTSLGRHLRMFNVRGDRNGRHHAPGAPMLDMVTGVGFLVGCVVVLRRWNNGQRLMGFLLLALGLTLLPSLLAVEGPHAMRSIGAVGFACALAAVGWVSIGSLVWAWVVRRWPGVRGWRVGGGSLLLLPLLFVALLLNVHTFFVAMPTNPEVWQAFYPVHTRMGAYIRTLADEEGPQVAAQVYVPADLADNAVLRYLTHGLPVQTFRLPENGVPGEGTNEEHTEPERGVTLSRPAAPGARFLLSGYATPQEQAAFVRSAGLALALVRAGPLLPDGKTPSFFVYQAVSSSSSSSSSEEP